MIEVIYLGRRQTQSGKIAACIIPLALFKSTIESGENGLYMSQRIEIAASLFSAKNFSGYTVGCIYDADVTLDETGKAVLIKGFLKFNRPFNCDYRAAWLS